MTRARALLAALIAINALLIILGLGRGKAPAESVKRLKIGLVFDVGGLGDKSFNDAAYRGLTRAQEDLDVAVRMIEPGDGGSDRESAIRELAADGYDLVIGVGFIFTDDMRAAAKRFPKVKFACIDYSIQPGQSPPPPNLVGLRFREEEGSYLVGALAGMVSKTKKVGFVGGMEIPLIKKFEAGYRAGVARVCPTCQVFASYAGADAKAFADPTTGKEQALTQYNAGADIIFHAAGKTGIGVFNAAQQLRRKAIGVDVDQFHDAPCCVLSSMWKGVDVAVYDTIHAVAEGRFQGGIQEFGLAEGGVGYIYDDHNRAWISEDVHKRVEELRREIIEKKVTVPHE